MEKPVRVLLMENSPSDMLAGCLAESIRNHAALEFHLKRLSTNGVEPDQVTKTFAGALSRFRPDLILVVLPAGSMRESNELIQSIQRSAKDPLAAMAFVEDQGNLCGTMTWMPMTGCIHFIPGPLSPGSVAPLIAQLARKECRSELLPVVSQEKIELKSLVGKSVVFLEQMEKLPTVANCNSTVLISGETGTGKEICAQAIHYLSPRAGGPFIPVNCGAIPPELAENELFGHRTGAFTGASPSKDGLVQEANGGTLFLDEVDALPPLIQVKLLRFLQDRTYRPLGSAKERQVDVRIIAAMGTHPEEALQSCRLRRDLYYRLNVIAIKLPPLRDRLVDIPLLARHFLRRCALELGKEVDDFSDNAIEKLAFYDWPGNVRELEHIIERALVLSPGKMIQATDIDLPHVEIDKHENSFGEAKKRVIDQFEKTYIRKVLMAHQGNISSAARAAQKPRRAFWELIRKHKIDVRKFKH